MNVFITGGCGFIGSNLIRFLSSLDGFHITVYDNLVLGSPKTIEDYDVNFIEGDICDQTSLARAMEGADVVVHLAADTRVIPSIEAPRFNFDVNVVGSMNVLETMRELGVKRLISASTGGAIIGEVPPPVHEEMVPKPVSPYGASKLAVEGYCGAYAACYDMNIASLRFSNVYGPGSLHKGSVVATFFRNILAGNALEIFGDGTQTRDYVFVEDLCKGILACMTGSHVGVFQLGSGAPLSILELIDAMKEVVAPREVQVVFHDFRSGEIKHTYTDIGKAREQLGFRPDTTLKEGLTATWEWFLQHQDSDGDGGRI